MLCLIHRRSCAFKMFGKDNLVVIAVCIAATIYPRIGYTKEMYDFYVTRMDCEDLDPRLTYNHTCFTRSVSRTNKALNIIIYMQPNASLDNIYVLVNYFTKTNNAYRRSVISAEENFCAYRRGKERSYLISILWPYLSKKSNLPDKCPFSNFINISGLVFEDKFLPPALPEGAARLDIHVREGKERISFIKVKLYIEIKPKGAIKLDF